MQNVNKPRRGRPRQFDEADVVAKALTTFWSRGYDDTTLEELEGATGVDRSTIYNSFGGKKGLYDKAAGKYVHRGESHLFAPLSGGAAGVDDIIEFLDRLEAIQLDDTKPAGCLIINDMANPANDDATDRYLRAIRSGLGDAIERSNRSDGTDPDRNGVRAESLLAAIVGVNLSHRRDPDAASTLIDSLRGLVRSWPGN